jgi:hypothetical protein
MTFRFPTEVLRRSRRPAGLALQLAFAASVLCASGCDNGLSTVTGTVTLDGQPLAGGEHMNGTITFSREGGGGAPAVGFIDDAGHYTVKTGSATGMEPGTYRVAIAMKKITIPADPNAMPIPTLITPAKYKSTASSGLRAEIKPGRNELDFALKSGAGT